MRTSVDSETAAPSSGSVCRRSVTAGASVHAESSSRPSTVGGRSARTALTTGAARPGGESASVESCAGAWSTITASRAIILGKGLNEQGGAAPGRGYEVFRQETRRVGDAAVAGQAADIDDIEAALTLDYVDTVQLDAERRPARQRDPAQLGTGHEGLTRLFGHRRPRKRFLDGEHPLPDHVELQIGTLGRVIALREDGLASLAGEAPEVGWIAHDAHMMSAGAVVRLDDQRPRLEQGSEIGGLGTCVCGGDGHTGALQHARGHNLVVDRRRRRVPVHDCGAQLVERTRETQGKPAQFPQHVQVVPHAERRQVERAGERMHDLDLGIKKPMRTVTAAPRAAYRSESAWRRNARWQSRGPPGNGARSRH